MTILRSEFGSDGNGLNLPLVAGSIRGYRMWTIGPLSPSILRSPQVPCTWFKSTGTSYCVRERIPSEGHDMLSCTCGFYAYFDKEKNPYREAALISGVVEASGQVVIGSKGFRAQNVRIVAIAPNDYLLKRNRKFKSGRTQVTHVSRLRKYARSVSLKLLRQEYPDIDIFETEKEMRRAFPVQTQKEVIQ